MTIGVLAVPAEGSTRLKACVLVAFAVLANGPDFRLPGWGHEQYQVSHSLLVNLGLVVMIAAPLLAWPRARRGVGGNRVIVAGGLAWLSHLLLDCMYNHGQGLAMFWPVSTARPALPVPWFETLREPLPHVDAHAARVMGVELLAYGLLLFAAVAVRRAWLRRRDGGS